MISEHILVRIWWLAPNLEFPISNEAAGQIFDVAIAGQYFDFMSTQPPELEKDETYENTTFALFVDQKSVLMVKITDLVDHGIGAEIAICCHHSSLPQSFGPKIVNPPISDLPEVLQHFQHFPSLVAGMDGERAEFN